MADPISRLNEIRRLSGYLDEDMRKGEPMSDSMTFPDTVEEFMEQYKVVDTEQVYTNGTEFVPIFRMRQWFQHELSAQPEIIRCRECKYASPNGVYGCRLDRFSTHDESTRLFANDYCSAAERRTDETD